MHPVLYQLSQTLEGLDSRAAVMKAMDEIDAVYDALNDIDRDIADDLMHRLQRRLDSNLSR
jgi:hypothetical protein